MNIPIDKRKGFSLVELSIVLVILGLLVGGVLSGQALIRASELRAVTTEFNRYVAATQAFRDKYFAIPGDMANATEFWGRSSATADCVTNSGAAVGGLGTCDGDGDGGIELPAALYNPNQSGENFQYWRQMQLAGMIEGNVSGTTGAGTISSPSPETFQPSKLGSNAYWVIGSNTVAWFGAIYPSYVTGQNTLSLGGPFSGGLRWIFFQEEMWNIDTKMDDGIPMLGNVVSTSQGWGGPGACIDGAAPGFYKVADRKMTCVFGGITKF